MCVGDSGRTPKPPARRQRPRDQWNFIMKHLPRGQRLLEIDEDLAGIDCPGLGSAEATTDYNAAARGILRFRSPFSPRPLFFRTSTTALWRGRRRC